MQTTLTTSHWRTLQEILLQQMEEKAERQVSVLIAGMPFIAQGVEAMLRGAPWIARTEVLAPQNEERFDVGSIEADVIFLTTPGTSRLLGRIAARYGLSARGGARALAGGVRESAGSYGDFGFGNYEPLPQRYPSEVVAADLALRAINRERRRLLAQHEAHSENAPPPPPPGLALMHISGAISREDIALSRQFGRPVSLHLRDGAKQVRTGIFAAAQGLTYCSPHAFAGHPDLFVVYGSLPDEAVPLDDTLEDVLPVADTALWQMLSEQNPEQSAEGGE